MHGQTMDIEKVAEFINAQTPETKIYIGGDSERFMINNVWHADYTLAVVVHYGGNRGCKIFGEVIRERDFDQQRDKPRMRLMNEVYKVAELFHKIVDAIGEKEVQIHLDINPDVRYNSSVVIQQAVGYIKGTCNVIPMVKPNAFAASYAADRLKEVLAA